MVASLINVWTNLRNLGLRYAICWYRGHRLSAPRQSGRKASCEVCDGRAQGAHS